MWSVKKWTLDSKLQTFFICSIRILNILEVISKMSFSKIAKCSTLQKVEENEARFDSEIEIIKATLGRAELESTERQQRLDHAQQCLADEKERYNRLASKSSDNALTEAEAKIEDLKEISDKFTN